MKNPKMAHNRDSETATKKLKLDNFGLNDRCTVQNELDNSSSTPSKSRFGRSHKPKLLGDFLSTDKKVSAVLKVSPGNQMRYFIESGKLKSPKKDKSPKKSPVKTPPKIVKKPLYVQTVISPAEIKVEANELEPVPGCEWMVGDLAWARVGNHPFWPCIINIDPTSGIFTRIRMFSRSLVPLRWLHVQFFGDHGRRSWLFSSAVMNYTGREAFENLAKSILSGMKRKDPRQVSALIVKPHLRKVWETAVNEAESLLNATREERVLHFRKLYPIRTIPVSRLSSIQNGIDENDPSSGQDSPVGPKKRGRKRKSEILLGDMAVAPKQIKLEKLDDIKEEDEEFDPDVSIKSKSLSPRKLSILERVRLSQKSSDTEETRSPSLRLKKKKEEEMEKKKILEEQKQIEKERKRNEIKDVGKEASKKDVLEMRRTRSENAKDVSKDNSQKDNLKKKKKKSHRKSGADFRLFISKHFDRVLDEHPDMKEKDVDKYLEKMWQDMDDQQKLRYRPRINVDSTADKGSEDETDESLSTDNEENINSVERTSNSSDKSSSPIPLALATSKSGIGKRGWSLFNGALPGKVCQICEKPGDTLRCKGPCSGTYHLECALNPLEMSARRQELKIEFKPKNNRKKKERRGRKKAAVLLNDSKDDSLSDNLNSTVKDIDETIGSNKTDGKEDESFGSEKEIFNEEKDERVKEDSCSSSLDVDGAQKSLGDRKSIKEEEKEVFSEDSNEEKENGQDKSKDKKSRGKGSKESNESGEEVEGQGEFRCPDCSEGRVPPCFFCGLEEKNGDKIRIRCHIAHCGKVYHAECLKAWPQTSWTPGGKRGSLVKADVMTCPQHSCHTCVSDNPGAMKARFQNDKLVRCLRCPTSYHYGNYCLPAGSEVITSRQIICPKHYRPQKRGTHHVNAAWCFICATGGSLICCDLCPTAFHADCLKISPPEGGYVCEDCETGRFPLYGEVVWVKLGSYRWWPAQILFPYQIPENIQNLAHSRGEFAVRFFGSHDHYWVNRGRVFLYQEGDSGKGSSKHSQTDQVFLRAVQEASDAYLKLKSEKALRDAETRPGLKPPYYIKIKTNKPVGAVRMMEANVSSMTPCECDPNSNNPCAPDSDCLNRILMVECNPLICPAGDNCQNQLFEKRHYPPLMPYRTEGRGWGLKTLTDLKKGQFVIEYVGEMIDEEEYQKRLKKMHEANDENYYFLTIDRDRMLDAGPKGNVARFMNHSCQPNCETQKWTVNGDTRVGLFSLCDIPADTELVFNYNLESIGTDKKPCMCGASNCSGFIGAKATKIINGDEDKKTVQLRKGIHKRVKVNKSSSSSDDICFICGEGGELLLCDSKDCPKGYHLSCLKRTKWPQGKWLCPWHQCNICNKGKVKRCTFCVNSFCPNHVEGNIRLDDNLGLVCSKHDNKAEVKETIQGNKKPETELLGVEVDSLMEVDEALNGEEISEVVNESAIPQECVPLSSSSPIPPLVSNNVNIKDKAVNNTTDDEKKIEKISDSVTTLDDLTELVVNKPTREYRNKRLRSSSDIVNGVRKSINSSRSQRPVSIDSPAGVTSSNSRSGGNKYNAQNTLEIRNKNIIRCPNQDVPQDNVIPMDRIFSKESDKDNEELKRERVIEEPPCTETVVISKELIKMTEKFIETEKLEVSKLMDENINKHKMNEEVLGGNKLVVSEIECENNESDAVSKVVDTDRLADKEDEIELKEGTETKNLKTLNKSTDAIPIAETSSKIVVLNNEKNEIRDKSMNNDLPILKEKIEVNEETDDLNSKLSTKEKSEVVVETEVINSLSSSEEKIESVEETKDLNSESFLKEKSGVVEETDFVSSVPCTDEKVEVIDETKDKTSDSCTEEKDEVLEDYKDNSVSSADGKVEAIEKSENINAPLFDEKKGDFVEEFKEVSLNNENLTCAEDIKQACTKITVDVIEEDENRLQSFENKICSNEEEIEERTEEEMKNKDSTENKCDDNKGVAGNSSSIYGINKSSETLPQLSLHPSVEEVEDKSDSKSTDKSVEIVKKADNSASISETASTETEPEEVISTTKKSEVIGETEKNTKCSKDDEDNSSVECKSINPVISSTILSVERSVTESCDAQVTKDIVSYEKDSEVVLNGSCTVNSNSVSV